MTGINIRSVKKWAAPAGKALYFVLLLCFSAALVHPDLMETANHSYLLLDSVFGGRFLEFYNDIGAHANDLYYINAANYNIAVYVVFAVWELPVYLINRMFSLHVNEAALWLWAGLFCAGLLVPCAWQLGRLAQAFGAQEGEKAPWLFLLSPIPFLLAAFGFYDLPAVLLMLLALRFYAEDDMVRFSLLMGCAALFKVFALLLFVPLLLLMRKRPLRDWLPLGALALAPYAATTVPFLGRMGNVSGFMDTMLQRMFENTLGFIPLMPAVLAALSVWCYLLPARQTPAERLRAAAGCGLAVFGALLLFLIWHPQWAVFLFPFYILTVLSQRNRRLYDYLSPLLSGCILLYSFTLFPRHLETNLLVWGAVRFTGWGDFFLYQPALLTRMQRFLPDAAYISLFAAVLLCILIFRFCVGNGRSLADRALAEAQPVSLRNAAIGFGLVVGFYVLCLAASLRFRA